MTKVKSKNKPKDKTKDKDENNDKDAIIGEYSLKRTAFVSFNDQLIRHQEDEESELQESDEGIPEVVTFTVGDLIEALSKFDPKFKVFMSLSENQIAGIEKLAPAACKVAEEGFEDEELEDENAQQNCIVIFPSEVL